MTCSAVTELLCTKCGKAAQVVTGKELYPHREDLWNRNFYACLPCKMWVGVHPGTLIPLGSLASAELRFLRHRAHELFDKMWHTRRWSKRKKDRRKMRNDAYLWLAEQMGIDDIAKCHIGMFTEEQCRKAIRILGDYWKDKKHG